MPAVTKNSSKLNGLELARSILWRLTENGDTVQTVSLDFDGNEDFILSVVSFLKDIEWMKDGQHGSYEATGKSNFQGV